MQSVSVSWGLPRYARNDGVFKRAQHRSGESHPQI
jgi:hypothetical protein